MMNFASSMVGNIAARTPTKTFGLEQCSTFEMMLLSMHALFLGSCSSVQISLRMVLTQRVPRKKCDGMGRIMEGLPNFVSKICISVVQPSSLSQFEQLGIILDNATYCYLMLSLGTNSGLPDLRCWRSELVTHRCLQIH